MRKKKTIPDSPLKDQPWPLTHEQDLAIFLIMLEERFRKDSSDPLPAFEALGYIASYVWQSEEPSKYSIPVPWWIAQALATGFHRYRDCAETSTPLTLGEAFKLEGGGQGKEPRIQRSLRQLRDLRIATAIALAKADGIKIEASLQKQAEETGLSVAQVRRVWEATASAPTVPSATTECA